MSSWEPLLAQLPCLWSCWQPWRQRPLW